MSFDRRLFAAAAVRAAVHAGVLCLGISLMGCKHGITSPPPPPEYGQLTLVVDGATVTMDGAFVGLGEVNGQPTWHLGGGIGFDTDPDFSASGLGSLAPGDYVFGGASPVGTDHAEYIENEIGFRTDDSHALTIHVIEVSANRVTGTLSGVLHQDNTADPEVTYTVHGSFDLPLHRN